LGDRPEIRGGDFTGENDASFDEAGAADAGAGSELYVHSGTAS